MVISKRRRAERFEAYCQWAIPNVQITALLFTFTVHTSYLFINETFDILKVQVNGPSPKKLGSGENPRQPVGKRGFKRGWRGRGTQGGGGEGVHKGRGRASLEMVHSMWPCSAVQVAQ